MSYTVYPVKAVPPFCDDYAVTVNGTPAELNTARVSAVPFNRRWPGHQRSMDQSEAIQFLSMETDEPLTFEICPKAPFDPRNVKIRPQSLGIVPAVKDGVIRFTLPNAAYCTVEPFGRNRALHIFADPAKDYGISPDDENVIFFGAGEHDAGTIHLKSHQTLYLDAGAVVYGLVRAMDAEDIKILGHGILDNSRNVERIRFEANAENNDAAVNNAERDHTIQLEYCTGVEIDGITVRDSLVYNVRPIGCRDLTVRNVKIIGCWRYNSDGIDMHNCTTVRISDCFVRTFDDCICVKGMDCYYDGDVEEAVRNAIYRNGKSYDVFRDVIVENCVLWNDWGKALEIGAETRAEEICDVTFRNCDLIHLTHTALDCMNVDYADVHDVTYENINVEMDEPIPAPLIQTGDSHAYENRNPEYRPDLLRIQVVFHHEYSAGGSRRGKNRDFTLRNIHLLSPDFPGMRFEGYDETHKTQNVRITGLTRNGIPVTSLDQTKLTVNPFAENITIEE